MFHGLSKVVREYSTIALVLVWKNTRSDHESISLFPMICEQATELPGIALATKNLLVNVQVELSGMLELGGVADSGPKVPTTNLGRGVVP